jgi:antirestriction protein ArdC
MSVLDNAHPRVRDFILHTGIRIMSLNEFDAMVGGMTQRGRSIASNNAGFYNVKHDVIVINTDTPNAISILDRTILHELGHATGHSTRMQRKVIVNTERQMNYESADLSNEEIIAEMIAFQLGSEMGLMTPEWQSKSENYIASYTDGSAFGARDEVKRAVWYLLKIVTASMKAS